WIHDQPRTTFADAEASGFRAKDRDGEFSCFGLEDVPQGFADSWIAAIRADAEEQMPRRSRDLLLRHLRIGGIDFRRAHRYRRFTRSKRGAQAPAACK